MGTQICKGVAATLFDLSFDVCDRSQWVTRCAGDNLDTRSNGYCLEDYS